MHGKYLTHRDLKLENILVSKYEKEIVLKISDFGLAKYLSFSETCDEFCGTLNYMPPEMIEHSYNHLVDFWSLGVIIYFMAFRYFPFNGKDEKELIENIKSKKFVSPIESVGKDLKCMLKYCFDSNPYERLNIVKVCGEKL